MYTVVVCTQADPWPYPALELIRIWAWVLGVLDMLATASTTGGTTEGATGAVTSTAAGDGKATATGSQSGAFSYECPLIYFFVRYCLGQGAGVPKPALALYDRMNMQLSREFIRCGNPTCELNRLDNSTGHIKFKKCSRCNAVIYCSRACQVAHYPTHKAVCKKSTV